MKTVNIEVHGLLSAMSGRGLEKQLLKMTGVKKAEVNYVAGSATVVYDETVIDLKSIKVRVQECGYHCTGEQLPKHVCVPEDHPDAVPHSGHGEHKYAQGTGLSTRNGILFKNASAQAMPGSSALVAVNALLLKSTRLEGIQAFRSGSAEAHSSVEQG